MKTFIPDKCDDMFTTHDRKVAPEGLIQMFLEREENAKRLETKTGNSNMLEVPPNWGSLSLSRQNNTLFS